MKIADVSHADFKKVIIYISSLCGYPSQTEDKLEIIYKFLKDQHGHNTIEELTDAYNQLAAGRLDEKMDSFKS